MAATLANATTGAFRLTGMAHLVAADRTDAAMVSTGALATRPTETAAILAILLAAHRTKRHAAAFTQNILAGGALGNTSITNDMAVAVKRHLGGFLAAGITGGSA